MISTMTIHLVANDGALQKLCRDILSEMPQLSHSWTLVSAPPDTEGREADIYIWDFHPNLALPENVSWNPLRHLFLVDRKDLAVFQERTGVGEGNVLLKPVGR